MKHCPNCNSTDLYVDRWVPLSPEKSGTAPLPDEHGPDLNPNIFCRGCLSLLGERELVEPLAYRQYRLVTPTPERMGMLGILITLQGYARTSDIEVYPDGTVCPKPAEDVELDWDTGVEEVYQEGHRMWLDANRKLWRECDLIRVEVEADSD